MLKTPEEFVQSLADLHLEIYLFGDKVDDYVNHPIIRPSINCMAMTYELARLPEYEDLMLATSHITGEKVNRFTNIHQSADDLVKKFTTVKAGARVLRLAKVKGEAETKKAEVA